MSSETFCAVIITILFFDEVLLNKYYEGGFQKIFLVRTK